MAIINDWKSSKEYDNKLSEIEHYSEGHHPEMMPFVGSHYNETGILIVGESHFYEYDKSNNQESEKKYLEELWYVEPTPDVFSYKNNFNTRGVIHNFLIHKRTKAHSMFRNPAECIIDVYGLSYVSDSEAFNAFAFMNYFQKPALEAHKSIDNSSEDAQIAFDTFISVCEVISPKIVVFLSKKAYENYTKYCNGKAFSIPADFVYHPTCAYWNKDGGKEKFERIISQNKKDVSFSKYRYYSNEEVMRIVPDHFVLKKPKQKRFIKDITTIRLYENPKGIYEFAVHILAGGSSVGVGYNVENQSVWIWDYDNKKYIEIEKIDDYAGLREMYTEFIKFIKEL